ncbi:phage tail protein [Paenibacillaceae bacterium]|nr:phage tail protein [Paenibacillaceae bacterium]
MKQIPDKLINYTAYRNGSEFLGTVDVTLPSIEALTETMRGAGIAGEIDSPTLGHYASMSVTLNWRTITGQTMSLHAPVSHTLDFRGAQQVHNTGTGEMKSQGIKVTVKALPKSGDIGKLDPGTTTDTTNEMEVTYIKIMIDGKTVLEIDKLNFKAVFNGKDYLAQVRQQLGL